MRNHIIATILLLLSLCALSALAGWERTYGGIGNDAATSVVLGEDGGYVIAGYRTEGWWDVDTTIFGSDTLYDSTFVSETLPFAMKIDESGDSVWMRTYDTEYFYLNILPKIVRVTGSGYALLFGNMDKCIIRTDNLGNELWRSTISSHYDYYFAPTSDGGFVFTGKTGPPYDMLLDKRDSLCNPEWTEEYGGSEDEEGYSVAQTSDGGYIIGGMTETWGSHSYNTWVVRTDSLGVALWAKVYGEWGARSIIETDDGGFAFIEDFYILYRTDSDGDTLWTCSYYYYNELYECIQTSDGGYIVAGYTYSFGAGLSDVYLVKTDAVGDTIWTRTYGGSDWDYGHSVAQTSDGGYIVAGYTYSFGAGLFDVYLIKTDSLGFTGIEESDAAKPAAFAISAYPNPFNSAVSITIDCHSRENGNPEIEIFDINGRRIDVIARRASPDEAISPNNRSSVPLDTRRDAVSINNCEFVWQPDAAIGSGVYLVRAKFGDESASKRIVYLK